MRDPSGLDLLVTLLGTLGALLLLVATFAAAAQEQPQTTDPVIVSLADSAEGNRAYPMGAAAVAPSLVFGHFRERYGSIVPGAALHLFYNAGYFLLVAPRALPA